MRPRPAPIRAASAMPTARASAAGQAKSEMKLARCPATTQPPGAVLRVPPQSRSVWSSTTAATTSFRASRASRAGILRARREVSKSVAASRGARRDWPPRNPPRRDARGPPARGEATPRAPACSTAMTRRPRAERRPDSDPGARRARTTTKPPRPPPDRVPTTSEMARAPATPRRRLASALARTTPATHDELTKRVPLPCPTRPVSPTPPVRRRPASFPRLGCAPSRHPVRRQPESPQFLLGLAGEARGRRLCVGPPPAGGRRRQEHWRPGPRPAAVARLHAAPRHGSAGLLPAPR